MEGRISEVGEKSITYEGGTFSGLSLNPSITIIRRSVGADFFFCTILEISFQGWNRGVYYRCLKWIGEGMPLSDGSSIHYLFYFRSTGITPQLNFIEKKPYRVQFAKKMAESKKTKVTCPTC
jgi:hypothetical protein